MPDVPSTRNEGTQSQILVSTGGVTYDAVGVAVAGATVEFVMPTAFHTCLVEIAVQGAVGDAWSTLAGLLYNIEAVEIFTTEGEALRLDGGNGLDVFMYSWWVCKEPFASYLVGGTTKTKTLMTVVKIPLSFDIWRWFNHAGEFAGLDLDIADRLRVTFSSDANAVMEDRLATIMAFGLKRPDPILWRTTIPDAYTAAVDQGHWTELPTDTRLAGVWTHHETTFNDNTTQDVFGIQEQRLAYGRTSFFKRVKNLLLQNKVGMNYHLDPDKYLPMPPDEYTYWPLDPCNEGGGEPNPGNLVIESVGGIAEDVRVYPVVWRLLK